MELLATAEEMHAFDRRAIDGLRIPGLLLMENAGRGFVEVMERETGPLAGKRIDILCGKGNNGGDGFVIARHALARGAEVRVLLLVPPGSLTGHAALQFAPLKRITEGISVERFKGSPRPAGILVDALFGTGFTGEMKPPYLSAVRWMNRSGSFVAAVDVPSGVHGTSGRGAAESVRADLTVAMGLVKTGHVVGAGRDLSGRVVCVGLGVPPSLFAPSKDATLRITSSDVAGSLPRRSTRAHKYGVGKVFILGGSRAFTGAPALAAEAALRSGCGAVVLGIPASIHQVLAKKLTEVILLPLSETSDGTIGREGLAGIRERMEWADVVAIGPGLGRNTETDDVVRGILTESNRTAVVDADGLNALAGATSLLRKRSGETVLTPHAGELGRLTGESTDEIEADRIGAARRSAGRFGCTVLLKGSPTVTATSRGIAVVNDSGNPGMATIGSGDVLTGMVASFIAQGMRGSEGAWCGAYLHGAAGDAVAARLGERSLLAGDLLSEIPRVLQDVEGVGE